MPAYKPDSKKVMLHLSDDQRASVKKDCLKAGKNYTDYFMGIRDELAKLVKQLRRKKA